MTLYSPVNYAKSLKMPENKSTEPHNLERLKTKQNKTRRKILSLEKSNYKDFKTLAQIQNCLRKKISHLISFNLFQRYIKFPIKF